MSRYLVNLKKGADELVPSVFVGIDTSNLLFAQYIGSAVNYTATQDCYAYIYNSYGLPSKVDGIWLSGSGDANYNATYLIPLKRGQTLYVSYTNTTVRVYGAKF